MDAASQNQNVIKPDTLGPTLIHSNKIKSFHQPYRIRLCTSCHDPNSVGNMIDVEPGICYQCHERFDNKYSYVHGPVQGGFCTTCHDPHSSKEKTLLKESLEDLCLFCHNSESLSPVESHEIEVGESCIDCHNPHGGASNLMLTHR